MTKIINLFENNETVEKKPIKFHYLLDNTSTPDVDIINAKSFTPSQFDNITLLEKVYKDKHLIMAWYDADPEKFIFIGDWGDGVVE